MSFSVKRRKWVHGIYIENDIKFLWRLLCKCHEIMSFMTNQNLYTTHLHTSKMKINIYQEVEHDHLDT
jgi:hypothetical protein